MKGGTIALFSAFDLQKQGEEKKMLGVKRWLAIAVAILGLVLCGSVASAAEGVTAVIDGGSADKVHLREGPSANAKSLGLYFTGTEVLCGGTPSTEWTWVAIGAQGGYMKSEFLSWGADLGNVIPKQPMAAVGRIKAGSWVNLRKEPTRDGAVAGRLYQGDGVTVLGETASHWYYVKAGDQYGYIMSDYAILTGAGSSSQPPSKGVSPLAKAALGAYQSVLQNDTAFFSPYDNQTMTLDQLLHSFGEVPMEITQFAVMDLDQDGIPEVILREIMHGYDYGAEVLRYQDGAVYGYGLAHRAFGEVKADGTFSFSSGASDNGFGTLRFTHNAWVIEEKTYCQSSDSNKNGVSYFVDRKPATADAFHSAVNKQHKKPDATWYDLTEANIKRVLSEF